MCEKGVLVMKIKVKNLTKIWLLFTIILTCACIWSVFQINILGDYLNVEECQVEVEMAGLPNLSVVEREEEVIVEKNTIIPTSEIKTFDNTEDTQFLQINLYQGDSILCSENEYIGSLVYDYGNVRKAHTGIVEVEITVDRNGRILLECTDILNCVTQSVNLVIK